MKISYEAIGDRIRTIRTQQNMTQDKLATLCNLSTQHISNIEHAHTKLSLPAIINIANALKVSVDELLCDSMYKSKAILQDDFARVLADASETEAKLLLEAVKALHLVFARALPEEI